LTGYTLADIVDGYLNGGQYIALFVKHLGACYSGVEKCYCYEETAYL